MKIQKQIEVRLARKGADSLIRVVQYDTGVQLVFNMMDFELPDNTSATLYVRKKSGKFVYQETGITVTATTVTVDLENQALTEHGEASCQLRLVNGADTISTFATTIIVDPSYRDADAVESKTVIAAFEAKTAEQIAEIEAAAQDQIEVIQNLYSTYATKNEAANAVKGNLSGAVVFTDDVSPVEHEPKIWVHGKNLLKNTAVTQTIDGVAFTANGDGSVTANGTAGASAPIRYNLGEVVLPPGNYLISGQNEGVAASFVMYSDQDGNNHQQHSGQDPF